MKRFRHWFAAALLPLLASCSFSLIPSTEYIEQGTFDLASPVPFDSLPFIVEVDAFSNECSGRFKMVFREDNNQIKVDEFNHWSMPPGAMVTKYLSARFASATGNQNRTKKPVFELDGTVLNCEMNKPEQQVDLMVHYFIIEQGDENFKITGTENYRIPVKDTSAESFAEGMNEAVSKLADQIVTDLTNELKARGSETKKDTDGK